MTFAVRFCVRCAAEDLPWHSWPPQALEELADEIGIGQDPRALLDSIRAQRDGRPDANAERLEQLHSDQFDILSLCVASNSKDLARVALVADLLSTARSTAAARRGPAAVAYTVARSYAHEGAWEHATWWSEFAVGHDEFGAYADLINAIARAGVDTEEARLACQRSIQHWPEGIPCTGPILLEGTLGALSSASEAMPTLHAALAEHLRLLSETLPDPEPAFAKAMAGVALMALGDTNTARRYIDESSAHSRDAALRVHVLLRWLVRELAPGTDEATRQNVLAEVARLGSSPPEHDLG